jgi:hypothetical protein
MEIMPYNLLLAPLPEILSNVFILLGGHDCLQPKRDKANMMVSETET